MTRRKRSMTPWRTPSKSPCSAGNRTVHREAWVDLFIRYNTPLPSSAAVKRMFCTGGDILRAKRSFLAGYRFEDLLFLKDNLRHLGHQILEKSVEEEAV